MFEQQKTGDHLNTIWKVTINRSSQILVRSTVPGIFARTGDRSSRAWSPPDANEIHLEISRCSRLVRVSPQSSIIVLTAVTLQSIKAQTHPLGTFPAVRSYQPMTFSASHSSFLLPEIVARWVCSWCLFSGMFLGENEEAGGDPPASQISHPPTPRFPLFTMVLMLTDFFSNTVIEFLSQTPEARSDGPSSSLVCLLIVASLHPHPASKIAHCPSCKLMQIQLKLVLHGASGLVQ